MQLTDLINKLNHPESVNENDNQYFTKIIDQYPYLQSVRALYLKGLHSQRNHLYNSELKKTAAYTTDRDVLFDFIISEDFSVYKPLNIENVEVIDEDYLITKKPEITLEESIEKSILSTLAYIENEEKEPLILSKLEQRDAHKTPLTEETIIPEEIKEGILSEDKKTETAPVETLEEKLEIGTPIEFTSAEKHSFSEWLQLTKAEPIKRKEEETAAIEPQKEEKFQEEKRKKEELINRFIETNPKIIPNKNTPSVPVFIEKNEDDQSFLMTETLAKIYLEQKKYQKAIQAYEILILKYPEKSSLFADRISNIKMLQNYNS